MIQIQNALPVTTDITDPNVFKYVAKIVSMETVLLTVPAPSTYQTRARRQHVRRVMKVMERVLNAQLDILANRARDNAKIANQEQPVTSLTVHVTPVLTVILDRIVINIAIQVVRVVNVINEIIVYCARQDGMA